MGKVKIEEIFDKDPQYYVSRSIYIAALLKSYKIDLLIPEGLDFKAHYFFLNGVLADMIRTGKIPISVVE